MHAHTPHAHTPECKNTHIYTHSQTHIHTFLTSPTQLLPEQGDEKMGPLRTHSRARVSEAYTGSIRHLLQADAPQILSSPTKAASALC